MRRLQTHPLYYKIRQGVKQLILPICIFQLIRTILFPTGLDVILLVVLIVGFISFEIGWL